MSRRLATVLAKCGPPPQSRRPSCFPEGGAADAPPPLAGHLRRPLPAAARAGLPEPCALLSLRCRHLCRWTSIGQPSHVIRGVLGYAQKTWKAIPRRVSREALRRVVDVLGDGGGMGLFRPGQERGGRFLARGAAPRPVASRPTALLMAGRPA